MRLGVQRDAAAHAGSELLAAGFDGADWHVEGGCAAGLDQAEYAAVGAAWLPVRRARAAAGPWPTACAAAGRPPLLRWFVSIAYRRHPIKTTYLVKMRPGPGAPVSR
jgi:hypothetical protein